MSSDASYNFADWYRPVDNQLNPDTQNHRIKAINVLMNNTDQSFWLDVIRLYVGIPIKDVENKKSFIKAFKDEDSVFPVSGNDQLIRTLASILLCFRLDIDFDLNNVISLAIANLNFLGQYDDSINVPVFTYAKSQISNASKNIRDLKVEAQKDGMDELSDRIEEDDYEFEVKDQIVVVDAVKNILHAQKVFSEETNILWWLFGEASLTYNDSLKTIGLPKVIPVIARELFDLLQFELGTQKMRSLINKAVLNSYTTKNAGKLCSPYEMICKFTSQEIGTLLKTYKPDTEFTPLLSAFYKYSVYSKSNDLTLLYSDEFNGGDLKKTFEPTAIAFQLFNEFLLLKNMH